MKEFKKCRKCKEMQINKDPKNQKIEQIKKNPEK